MNLIKNIKGCYKHIPYTWNHYLAFLKVEKQLLGYYKYKFHDWDKLILFILFPFLGEEFINQVHQRYQSHHPTCYIKIGNEWVRCYKSQKSVDWVEAIIDWECARFTKPDKPLNARETFEKFYSEYKGYFEVEDAFKLLNL